MLNDDPPPSPGRQLAIIAEKSLPAKCKPDCVAYCPTMDLVALVTDDEELRVFRLKGQRVFGGSFCGDPYLGEKQDVEIVRLAWKTNGRLLAVACSDGTVRLINSYSGKTVHHYSVYPTLADGPDPRKESAKITCLGWGVNFTDIKSAQRHLDDTAGQLTIEDLLSPNIHPSKAASFLKADLPVELASLDIESSLPKLSTLPGTGGDNDVFSSRASIDAIFHSASKNTNESVDVLLVGFNDGTIHLRIFDCFEIGSFQLGNSAGFPDPYCPLQHASHPLSSTHVILASGPASDCNSNVLHFLTVDLRFVTKSGRYLSLLAHKITQLQNLLRYISQVQRQIELEWKSAQELPGRYMRSVSSDLEEKCHCDFVTAMYHLIVTGDCFAPLKEFLVDIVGERGHKRWEKAVITGYENIRRLTHECLLPALERCEVLFSRLTGLSKFHRLSGVLGLETRDLKAATETLDCLHLLAHRILIHANEELDQFMAFSKWLRHEIDMQAAEPMSQTLEELIEKADIVDHSQTLKYIQGALTTSRLRDYIHQLPITGTARSDPGEPDKSIGRDRSFYDNFKELMEQRAAMQASGDGSRVKHPKLDDLTRRLGLQFENIFGGIALAQRQGILHRSALTLHPDCGAEVTDITMCQEDAGEGISSSAYIAARSVKYRYTLYIYHVTLTSANGVSSVRRTAIAPLSFGEGEIRQIQFTADNSVMILWSSTRSTYLISLPYRRFSQPISLFSYDDCDSNLTSPYQATATTLLNILSPESSHTGFIKHVFALSGPKSRPLKVSANARPERRAVCVVYGDGMKYEVFDMDTEVDREEPVEEDEVVTAL